MIYVAKTNDFSLNISEWKENMKLKWNLVYEAWAILRWYLYEI